MFRHPRKKILCAVNRAEESWSSKRGRRVDGKQVINFPTSFSVHEIYTSGGNSSSGKQHREDWTDIVNDACCLPAVLIFNSTAVFNTWPLRFTLQRNISLSHYTPRSFCINQNISGVTSWSCVAFYVFVILSSDFLKNAFQKAQERPVVMDFILYDCQRGECRQRLFGSEGLTKTLTVNVQSSGLFPGIRAPLVSFPAISNQGMINNWGSGWTFSSESHEAALKTTAAESWRFPSATCKWLQKCRMTHRFCFEH